ncbi:MAG: hypothetical protein Q9183_006244, partial [Haloplaca sp. 2 TL-2023]
VFTSIQSGTSTYGVVPFENSTYGTVRFTLDLLVDRENAFPSLLVCAETYLPVHHCLVGHPGRNGQSQNLRSSPVEDAQENTSGLDKLPNATPNRSPRIENNLQHISTIYSHPAAFGQCETFLSAHLKGVQQVEVSSTSAAAERVAQEGAVSNSCAISSKLAAELHGLQLLQEGIQDRGDNETRFFVLRKASDGQATIPSSPSPSASPPPRKEQEKWKTLISFTLPRQPSGTLADTLLV